MKSICFSDQVIEKIKATSFGHLYDLPKCIVPSSDLNALVSQYNGDRCFSLGENNFEFTVDDFKEILNIPNGDIEIKEMKIDQPTTDLEKMFPNETRIKRWNIARKLKEIQDGNLKVDDEMIVKLWICLLFTSFIMPDSTSAIHFCILKCIDNLESIDNFNWATYAHSVIINSMENLKSYCLGCSLALLVSVPFKFLQLIYLLPFIVLFLNT